ncbi:MAG: histidine kinase [Crocinitomicaceae bacterium]|nr:histidine kinase [Crocinitomicaceae bacterium]
MKSSKKLYWLAQFGGWTIYSCLIFLSAYIDRPNDVSYKLFVQLFLMTIFSIFFTHLMRLYMLSKRWLDFNLKTLIPKLLIISIICSTLIETILLITEFIISKDYLNLFNSGRIIVNILALSLLIICWNGIYFTYHFFQKSNQQELDNLSLEAAKNEIELKNLRSQLNPHFLFNSLNSIRALVEIEPQSAKSAITTLSNLLRKSLVSGKENLISIDEEIEIVKNYLDLEKIRFEERIKITWNIDQQLSSFLIPPFIIQTLVENAIKHGISQNIDGGFIKISTQHLNNQLLIIVENSGKLKNTIDTGIGVENTKRRLAIQYNNKAHFSISQVGENVVATLTFDYEKN